MLAVGCDEALTGPGRLLKLGVDVGNTHTDAVVVDQEGVVVAVAKTASTPPDVGSGILAALDRVLEIADVPAAQVRYVMVSSSHFATALATRAGLARTAVIRLCQSGETGLPPFTGWPEELRQAVSGKWYVLAGGCHFDGRPLHPLNLEELRGVLLDVKRKRLEALAVAAPFSLVNPAQEQEVAHVAREVLGPEFPITLSHEVGQLGLVERENSAILNAALMKPAREAAAALLGALDERGVRAEVYFAQNDGTVVSLEYGTRFPVLGIGCGYANSMRGASRLTGLGDCIVVDMGGTTLNVGTVVRGIPLESPGPSEVLGVRTNFRLPLVVNVHLGGGSVVADDAQRGAVVVGPTSVGHDLASRALSWGGDTFTLTDAALRLGKMAVADPRCNPARLRDLDTGVCQAALDRVREVVEDCIDLARPTDPALPVVLVGGAAPMIPDHLRGASRVVRPPHFQFAGAIGAACARVERGVDVLWYPAEAAKEEAVLGAAGRAVENTIAAGAVPGTVRVLEVEEVPLTYLPERVVRVRVRAAGSVGGRYWQAETERKAEKNGYDGR